VLEHDLIAFSLNMADQHSSLNLYTQPGIFYQLNADFPLESAYFNQNAVFNIANFAPIFIDK
jgi:hypothetical protein